MKEVEHPDPDIFRMYIPDIAAFTEEGYKPGETVICTGKIKHVGSTYTDQFDYLKLRQHLEANGELWRAYYLNSTPNPPTLARRKTFGARMLNSSTTNTTRGGVSPESF